MCTPHTNGFASTGRVWCTNAAAMLAKADEPAAAVRRRAARRQPPPRDAVRDYFGEAARLWAECSL